MPNLKYFVEIKDKNIYLIFIHKNNNNNNKKK